MSIKNAIKKIIKFENLSDEEMTAAMHEMMQGDATLAQIAGFLIGLEMKGPSVAEITAATKVMREMANTLHFEDITVTDIVGTGGDNTNTFNISTTCTFIIAAAGGIVAKHGNRSVSSSSGSADVLEYAGINLDLSIAQTKECIEKIGVGFLFAPQYHPALKFAAIPRKELGVRTFFNLLGPLINPANAPFLMVGVYAKKWLSLVANVLLNLNCRRALVVNSQDGLDEISIAATTNIAELKDQRITYYEINPEQFGFKLQPIDSLQVESPAQSYQIMLEVLNDKQGAARDIVLLNAGAAIYNGGLATSINEGIIKAEGTLKSGMALEKLNQLIAFSQSVKG